MTSRREDAVYVISVAAELAGVHPQTLRIYERRGLIEPYRTPGGTRRYSVADLERLSLMSLRSKVDQLQTRVREVNETAEKELRQVHRSYRSEIVLRRQILPDIRRKDK
jgi:MerR family transcriptional regulator/heat shock protein HspR